MNRRSAAILAAGLTVSLVIGVLAFALGRLGPDLGAAGRRSPSQIVRHDASTRAAPATHDGGARSHG